MADEAKAIANRQAREAKKRAYLEAIFARHCGKFRGEPASPATAGRMHSEIDVLLERDRSRSADSTGIRCARGCDHCCKVAVEVLPHEAGLLVEAARGRGVDLDEERLERQSRYGIDDWRAQASADRACVFLGDGGACTVYELRPNSCRKLLVVSEPALCDDSQGPASGVERWFSWEAEVLQSAAVETYGAELMPRALLKVLRNS